MPNLPRNSYSDANALGAYLKTVLPKSQLTVANVDSAHQPLVLLRTDRLIAAFAFSNGEMRKSYDVLYGGFKNYYAEQRGQWDAFDLAFVFLAQPNMPDLDHFCSNIETDVYFCRKFVIPLTPLFNLSLARLPFLPLTLLSGKSIRPASAQTFLQQCGVPAMLAKYLVVQYERGSEGIVEDCISRKFGAPRKLILSTNVPVIHSDQSAKPVRIESVTIENFRAYRKQQAFEIGTDVTVLYGPNGFGKTSFFDAIDFAVTGEIGRLVLSNEAHFAKVAQHLDSKSEESIVSISFRSNGAVRRIQRSVKDRKQALLDGQSTDRKAILIELTGGNIPAADRVENFVDLFRASHLFSQEQQELTKGFNDDCQLPAETVSRMLAFEDYANAVNKTDKVREIMEEAIVKANQQIEELSEQIAIEKKELERLSQTAKGHGSAKALNAEVKAFQAKIVAMGIAKAVQKPDMFVVRDWRATLESRLAESQSLSERISVLAKEVVGLPRIHSELNNMQQQLAEKEQALVSAEEKKAYIEKILQGEEQRSSDTLAKCKEIEEHNVLFEWVRNAKPAYAQLIEKQRILNDELRKITDALAQQRLAEEKAIGDLSAQETIATQSIEKLNIYRMELTAMRNLRESVAIWQTNKARLIAVVKSEQDESKSSESLRIEMCDLLPQIAILTAEEAQLSRQIAEVDKSQSEFRALVSQLQGHVHTSKCPLCGEDHGSKDELMRRIQHHVATDAASDARVKLTNTRERAKQLSERVASVGQKQKSAEAQFELLKKERAKLEVDIDQFSNSAVKLGIVINQAESMPNEQIELKLRQIKQGIADMDQQNQKASAAIDVVRRTLSKIKSEIATKSTEMNTRQVTLARLQDESNKVRSDPRLIQFSIDIDPAKLAELEKDNSEHLSKLKAVAAKSKIEAAKKRLEVNSLRNEIESLKAYIVTLRNQSTNFQKTVTQINSRLTEAKLPLDINEETLRTLIADQSRLQAQLLALRDSASNLELTIDAATTAAALTTLLKNIRSKEKALAYSEKRRNEYNPWIKYFEEISRLVSSQQNEAIANFTHEYGPIASIIQRRLRSVYGFDEIEIHSHESTISVRVKRNGEELRPIDYFSQSQQQTLLLGLFLTAASSQTWSEFSPVFLDDPVTHFDDLNTYAFLDLIVGLLESEAGKRQFIISTCDEKFLQLARQKFHHLGTRAKFYRFSAIGKDGPVVEDILTS